MKITGLITEYNPFHNGHHHHLQKAKEITGADHIVVVMSGDYVQRGTPAIMSKTFRTEMALKAGASAVFEIPMCYATGSAELFATGAISLLDSLGCIDSVVFGSECNDIETLSIVADFLQNEPVEYKDLLQQGLKSGLTFPAARAKATSDILDNQFDYANLLDGSNNILGIEYIKALNLINSPIKPYSIMRQGSNHRDTNLHVKYSSATSIRLLLEEQYEKHLSLTSDNGKNSSSCDSTKFEAKYPGKLLWENTSEDMLKEIATQVPSHSFEILKKHYGTHYPINQNDFSLLLKYKLLDKTPDQLVQFLDVSEELANRVVNQLNSFVGYQQFSQLLKTKEVTHSRVNRALLHIMLDIKKVDVEEYKQRGYHFYSRLLGFRRDEEHLISKIAKESKLPIITAISRSENISHIGRKMLSHDVYATNLYNSVVTDKYKSRYKNELSQGVIKL